MPPAVGVPHFHSAMKGPRNPNIIMIGEIRYPPDVAAAINAALTGHRVWTTLHANSALGIIKRLHSLMSSGNLGDPMDFICDYSIMAGLVNQCLVPVLCPKCKKNLHNLPSDAYRKSVLPDDIYAQLKLKIDDIENENVHVRGKGCEYCDHMGFVDQTVIAEIIITDDKFLEYVRKSDFSGAQDYWIMQGGQTIVEDAISKIEEGILDPYTTVMQLGKPLTFN